jgi:molybdenum cofactor cytidylyltransferase
MISAIVPAAGLSIRMGGKTPKPLLPWRQHTVIEQVVTTLRLAGLPAEQIVVALGHHRAEMEAVLAGHGVRCVFNPHYRAGEMLSTVQAGLRALPPDCTGALVALADQPQMLVNTVQQVLAAFSASDEQELIIPSYQMRRGHPIALPRWLWLAVLALAPGASLRTVINEHAAAIRYVTVDTPTILADLDTPEQYEQAVGGWWQVAGGQ